MSEREEFEAWYVNDDAPLDLVTPHEAAWAAWQAALAAPAQPVAVPREPTEAMQRAGVGAMFCANGDLKFSELCKLSRKGWRAMWDASQERAQEPPAQPARIAAMLEVHELRAQVERLTRERDEARQILSGGDYGSLPNDWTISRIADARMDDINKLTWQVRDTCKRAEQTEVTIAALQADAERYRWLRDTRRLYLGPIVGARKDEGGVRYILASPSLGFAPRDTDTLDAAIDAARKEGK